MEPLAAVSVHKKTLFSW